MNNPIGECLTDVPGERDYLAWFLDDSIRRLQKLEMDVISVKVDKKSFDGDIGSVEGGDQDSKIEK